VTANKEHAIEIFKEAVAVVQPVLLLPQYIKADADTITICNHTISKLSIRQLKLLAVGKAAAAMAQTAEQILGNTISTGLCITKYHHALPLQYCKTIEAAHPVPDENSVTAANEVLKLIADNNENDIILVLLSGGTSSLMADVPEGCTLAQLQTTFDLLVNSDASIHEINCVRKHLSKLKGGQLAKAAWPAKIITLVLSDVVGNNLDTIGSGLTVADTTTFSDALRIIDKYGLNHLIPFSVLQYLNNGVNGIVDETPKDHEKWFQYSLSALAGSNATALQAAAEKAKRMGYYTVLYQDDICLPVQKLAKEMMQYISSYSGELPACIIAGGETTVNSNGTVKGKGGRNQHFVLSALHELHEHTAKHQVTVLSGATDGTDGPTDAAGAVADSETEFDKIIASNYLRDFDSYNYFHQYGGIIKTGPTQTNVMDVVVILIDKK
jgi:glycerate 2-kinase